jgi:hypothetical protein
MSREKEKENWERTKRGRKIKEERKQTKTCVRGDQENE